MRIPPRITAGDTVSWAEPALSDPIKGTISSADYALSFSFRGPVQAAALDVVGVADGTGWKMAIGVAASLQFGVGATQARWFWQAYATKSGERLTVGTGILLVLPDLASISAGTFDGRSQAEKILEQINATILAKTTGGAVQEYTIGNRSMKYMPITDLMSLKSHYQSIVARERKAQRLKNGFGSPDRLGVRFK